MKATFSIFLLICCFFFVVLPAKAQVKNDNIEQRLVMVSDSVYQSTTVGCTIQRNCISQSLAGNCVLFHNDQWFEFTPKVSGRYFVNIGGQQCRDIKGVQLLVLTGPPCQPTQQKILNCTSLGNQDDVFIQLDSLQAGTSYLLNLDGYLHDFCSFNLEVSQIPIGLPVVLPKAKQQKVPADKVVQLRWQLPDSGEIWQFKILRREALQPKSKQLIILPLSRDTYGQPVKDYFFTDTLMSPGNYLYIVLGIASEAETPQILLRELHNVPKETDKTFVTLPLENFPNGAEIQVVLLDHQTGKLVKHYLIHKSKKTLFEERLYLPEFQEKGLKKLRIQLSYSPTHKKQIANEVIVEVPEKYKIQP